MPGRLFVASLAAALAAVPAAGEARITGATPHERILVGRVLGQAALFMVSGLVHVLEGFDQRFDNIYVAVHDMLTGRLAYQHAYSAEFGSGASQALPVLED